ncbi:putative mucin TcMUCII [Trypanosoma cruzi]|uniref:Mucin TcMUCII, putative n=2 Tax=Trypanosoma cruzi TaxID=5693 RepID=Q4CYF9_TRYCC|nr:mucin TcMUCII, putative [Trypanosoma cruzi]EAN85311.1 mucin TcMUCII, putative [Trypanosoma cruzi]PWV09764.1 putative mucin TcMUCII [Trypanosoma cruzi]|eukprot:XP_807162.1 mucin TcMUCII [Trypanosoma cruzi strain CL Brener]
MMTCRLLCALLVLALCCCPSVCMTTSEDTAGKSGKDSVSTNSKPDGKGLVTESLSTTSLPRPETHSEVRGTEKSHATATITKTPQSQNTSNNTQDLDDGNSNERKEHTNTVTANEQKKAAAPTTTTTTTTKAPTTTTTTTTTQATSTTTTEAPTTTTTRAPSLLREIDGSLSSSAWVCAPLLLAVSALAYTTVG